MHRRDIFKQLFSGDLMRHLQESDLPATQPQSLEDAAKTIDSFNQERHSPTFSATANMPVLRIDVACHENNWLTCNKPGVENTMLLKTHELSPEAQSFSASLELKFINLGSDGYAGIRFGDEGSEDSIDAGLTADGCLFIANEQSTRRLDSLTIQQDLRLCLNVIAQADNRSFAKLKLLDTWGNTVMVLNSSAFAIQSWSGSISLVSVLSEAGAPAVVFGRLQVEGEKLLAV